MAGIDNIRSNSAYTTTNRSSHKSGQATNDTRSQVSSSPAQDAVSLSSQSKAVSQMQSDMASSPAFDQAKVQAIKEAIANGSYVVDHEKLADNMIRFENELGGLG
jgi:negative regulator of flagellin synthesis FlgM